MSEWQNIKLENIIDITSSKRIFYSEYVESGVPFYRSKEIINLFNKNDIQTELFISEERFLEIKEKFGVPEDGDILLTSVGTLGVPYIVRKTDKFYFKDGNLTWFKKQKANSSILSKYLFYWLISPIGKQSLDEISIGSTQAALTITGLKSLEVKLPPLPEQKAIADVLSALDDKIDLLQRQNETLEKMAETLFRQWFIEEAKEDWAKYTINDLNIYISDYVANGSFASLKENVELITDRSDYALFIRNTDLKSNFTNKIYMTKNSYEFLHKTKLYGGEIIISNVADVGSVHICPYFNHPMSLGNNVIMLNSKFNHYIYLYFKSNLGQDSLYGITSGSVQQKFNKTDFRKIEVLLPNLEILEVFHKYVNPIFNKIWANTTQIQTLQNLRDTLLPKLMSGEARVKLD